MTFVESQSSRSLFPKENLDRNLSAMIAPLRSYAPLGGVQDPFMAQAPKIIRDPGFGRRMEAACDGNTMVPLHNYGRLSWVQNQLKERFGATVSLETIRKWFAGEVKARPDKLRMLAEIFQVDEAWLSLGVSPDMSPREAKARNASAEGVVNVLTGFIQIAGGHPAFPEDGDKRAEQSHIHLYSIIKGAQYAFHVSLAKRDENGDYRFVVPTSYPDVFVLGAVPTEGPGVMFVELPTDWIEANGQRKAGALEVVVKDVETELRRIRSFGERL